MIGIVISGGIVLAQQDGAEDAARVADRHMFRRTELHIVASFTESYLEPALVTLMSLQRCLSRDYRPVLHLIYHDLSPAALDAVASRIETRPIKTDFGELGAFCAHLHFPREAAAPIILADILPADIDRVLFLDADLLVVDDLSPLWKTDLAGRVFGAVRDPAIVTCGSPRGVKSFDKWGVPPDAPYLNAGVLVMDLEAWRRRAPLDDLMAYMRETGTQADQFHQEALNAVMWQDWMAIPDRWNMIGSLYGRNFGPYRGADSTDPAIFHYAGTIKPWRVGSTNPAFTAYREEQQRVKAALGNDAPPPEPTLRDRVLGLYDTRFRNFLYPVEHFLWKQRLL